jgi:hypothetical protein
VLTGSSSITRWNDRSVKDLAPLTVIPRGFGGSIMNDVLHHLDRVVLKYEPRAVLIYEGDNDTDISRGIPKTVILDQLSRIIANPQSPARDAHYCFRQAERCRWNAAAGPRHNAISGNRR